MEIGLFAVSNKSFLECKSRRVQSYKSFLVDLFFAVQFCGLQLSQLKSFANLCHDFEVTYHGNKKINCSAVTSFFNFCYVFLHTSLSSSTALSLVCPIWFLIFGFIYPLLSSPIGTYSQASMIFHCYPLQSV